MAPGPGNPELRWTVEEIKETPSRADGVSEKEERLERFVACDYARQLIRRIFNNEQEESNNKVQMLACYYVQLFFMFRSLRQEDAKTVAVSAAFLACKVADLPRKMRNFLRSLNQMRVQLGEEELGEADQKELGDRVLKIEFSLLRIIRFEFDFVLPLEALSTLAEALLFQLSRSQTFINGCRRQTPQEEAALLNQALVKTAEPFVMDSFMGFAPLLGQPRLIAAAALVIATRYIRREMPIQEICALVHDADSSLEQDQVRYIVDEILNVFRTKPASKVAAAPARPAGAG